ncbi:MAG: peptide chain release factor N(5)-glutamine methyltransferase [Gemmatimonas sp.]|uniref:peptide chain release factor N(5)-glutamine methyltransferase n=1 Tax=Gemmatimonas sp. UBA7669 TaxID=1946568 RepID=UPI0025BC3F39|nr:peptide chain release factor N(5)-glutamine methyltransferase [Gemmatimonas sp. UBA7669]MBA3919707.1 peptide chain release factor N(5)-glutamine methyltransferase [Gemmatimonas sp.]
MAESSSTLRDVLARCRTLLADAEPGSDDLEHEHAREAQLLVSGVLRLSPGTLSQRSARGDHLSAEDMARVEQALHRRLRGEPLAYAVGWAPFRHLELMVDSRVLIPRPETEEVVGHALALTADRPGGVAVDIGTGSGAIALALASEGQFERVVATDVSADALAVAKANAAALPAGRAPVEFRLGADLAPLNGLRPRVIVSNPPYIAYDEAGGLPPSVRDWEPPLALFAADGGMARYRALLAGARSLLEPGGWLVLELDANRAQQTAREAAALGWQDVVVHPDLSGRDRVLIARTPG